MARSVIIPSSVRPSRLTISAPTPFRRSLIAAFWTVSLGRTVMMSDPFVFKMFETFIDNPFFKKGAYCPSEQHCLRSLTPDRAVVFPELVPQKLPAVLLGFCDDARMGLHRPERT